MPFYKNVSDKRSREDKRRDAEQRSSFDDEGSHYRANRGDNHPPRGDKPFGDRPPRSGDRFDSRPPRGDKPFGNRPAYGGDRFDSRPPRGDKPFGNRPAYGGDRFDSRPPRGDKPFGDRPPRSGDRFDSRPPRGDKPFGDRPPRSGDRFDNRPPRGDKPFGNRPAYGGDRFDNRPPRGDKPFGDRPPRSGDRFDNRPPRGDKPFGDRPPRSGDRFDNRPPRGDKPFGDRPPRSGDRFDNRPPRGDKPFGDRPPRGGDRVDNRISEEPRSERRDGPAPRDYHAFRYEQPARPAQPTYDAKEMGEEELVPNENLLSGRNPIREALKAGRDIEKLLVARGDLSGSAREIIAMAKEQRVPVQEVDRARLDAITQNHQGMLAFASAYQYHTVEEMLAVAQERGEAPFLVLLDGITDPHNLGAIIRTAECAGAHGVIVQERRAVGLTPAAVKASAGAVEHIMVARVTNLVATMDTLKQNNIWIYAADMQGEDYTAVNFAGGAALVIGAEGEGVSRLVLENADKRVSLPIRGKLDSLNASVAAGILLYAVLKSR